MSDHTYIRITKLALGAVLIASTTLALAQPRFGNPSPTAGSDTSQRANASADEALYQSVEYANKNKRGPAVIVIPGEIKSNNATFLQKFTSNNIADFGEVELSSANFPVGALACISSTAWAATPAITSASACCSAVNGPGWSQYRFRAPRRTSPT